MKLFNTTFYRNLIAQRIMNFPKLWWLAVHFYAKPYLLSVIGIVRDDKNRILLFKHNYMPDPWALPGGWLKKGETPSEALEREVKEESGFIVRAEKLSLIGTSKSRSHMEFIVEAKLVGGEFRASTEVSEGKWIDEDSESAEGIKHLLKNINKEKSNPVGYYNIKWDKF